MSECKHFWSANEGTQECLHCHAERPNPSELASSAGSAATIAAADAWNNEGRTCLRMATIETTRGEYSNALNHQRNANICFAHELELRKLLNGESSDRPSNKEKS